jgi:hypothetical protein
VSGPRAPGRFTAALMGAVEMASLFLSLVALLSMGGGELDKLFAAFVFMVSLPLAVLVGIFLGIKLRSASPWRFAGPRQVIITVIAALLLLGFNSLFQEMGLIPRRVPLKDPFIAASTNQIISSLGDPRPKHDSMQ